MSRVEIVVVLRNELSVKCQREIQQLRVLLLQVRYGSQQLCVKGSYVHCLAPVVQMQRCQKALLREALYRLYDSL